MAVFVQSLDEASSSSALSDLALLMKDNELRYETHVVKIAADLGWMRRSRRIDSGRNGPGRQSSG